MSGNKANATPAVAPQRKVPAAKMVCHNHQQL